MWNNFFSLFFNVDVCVRQSSALSPVLSILYLSLLFYIFEKHIKNIKITVSFLSFINDILLISQEKSLEKNQLFSFL